MPPLTLQTTAPGSLSELQSPIKDSFEHFTSTQAEYFQDSNVHTSARHMQKALDAIAEGVKDDAEKKAFQIEMANFFVLFGRYLVEKSKGTRLEWDRIQSPSTKDVVPYASISQTTPANEAKVLSKLAVLKLNGGLGTTMGCVGPKSAIEVREGLTFLDLTVKQIEALNQDKNISIPLVLMNSFNTDKETGKLIKKYQTGTVDIKCFNQSRYPRISKESLLPIPSNHEGAISEWYPPGHGDVFESLYNSGVLDDLLSQGKEYLFMSNIDNLGATVDTKILNYMADHGAEFLMEVTDKTRADVKGGTLIQKSGLCLLEIAQVPTAHVEDFKSVKKFKIFNTNNLWINLKAIKRIVEAKELELEIIVNQKTMDSGIKIIQLETAVGAAIKHFKNAHGINVPRSRFLPVKNCSDLFVVQSDLYTLAAGQLTINPRRLFPNAPLVKLGDAFRKVGAYLSRFASPPHVIDLEHLTVSGDVWFGSDVTLRGTVIIVANHPSRIDIPSGAVLEDKVITGELRILDH